MTRRNYIILFLLGVGVTLIVAVFQHAPGYMDADYYFAGGLRLATGHGFTEPFLWNFLDDPAGLPHPSHAYWMPLASLLAAIGMKLSGITSFYTARIGFLVLAGFLPPLTAHLSFSLTSRRDHAILPGILAAVPAFYLSYLGTTDTFGIYMFLGGLFLLMVAKDNCEKMTPAVNLQKFANNGGGVPFLLGIVAGLMHLARAIQGPMMRR